MNVQIKTSCSIFCYNVTSMCLLKYLKFNIIHYIGYEILHIIFPVYLKKFFYFQYIAFNYMFKILKCKSCVLVIKFTIVYVKCF